MATALAAQRPRESVLARLKQFRPANWLPSINATRILWKDYAHFRSVVTNSAIDANGDPLPWYTYPAIEYLSQLDFTDKVVFEYGSGMSTLYWARKTRRVFSVEDDERWFEKIRSQAPSNATISLETDLVRFPEAIRVAAPYDVIVVDGPARGRTRLKCCHAAVDALREGGLIILDNSDWLPESAKALRDSGLLQVDFSGFAPICGHVQTTSLFFHRSFSVIPATDRLPSLPRGGIPKMWERPYVSVPGATIEHGMDRFRAVEDDREMEWNTPSGPRTFRVFSYLGGDDVRCIGIIDRAGERVLVTSHPVRPAIGAAKEVDRLANLSWDELRTFVSEHECRRCRL